MQNVIYYENFQKTSNSLLNKISQPENRSFANHESFDVTPTDIIKDIRVI